MKENFEEEQRMMKELHEAKYGDLDLDMLKNIENTLKKGKPKPKVGKKFKEDDDDNDIIDENVGLDDISFNPNNPYEILKQRYQDESAIIEENEMEEVE